MALIPPFFLDTVVAIGVGNDPKSRQWIGTGFLYGLHKPDGDQTAFRVFLITNKHVLAGESEVWVKFNASDDTDSKDYKIALIAKNGRTNWTGHPDEHIDVAAMFINAHVLRQEGRKFSFFESHQHVWNIENLKTNGVSEGDGIFALGFPMGLVDVSKQYVICRSGIISKVRDALEGKNSRFLVDATVFPGNSGGPVILRPQATSIQGTKAIGSASLIGIVTSYVPYEEVAVSRQTGKPRMIFQENSGLSVVVEAGKIHETVELADRRLLGKVARAKRKKVAPGDTNPPSE